MDSNIGSDDDIGYGIIDLDPYLNKLNVSAPQAQTPSNEGGQLQQSKGPNAPVSISKLQLRCFINYKRKPAGFVLFEGSFKE